jgi:hypothetical protein
MSYIINSETLYDEILYRCNYTKGAAGNLSTKILFVETTAVTLMLKESTMPQGITCKVYKIILTLWNPFAMFTLL